MNALGMASTSSERGSEIVTLSDQFVHFSDDLFVDSNAEFLFCYVCGPLRPSCT